MVELVLMAQGVAVVVVIALRWVLCADVTLSLPQAASELYWGGLLYLSKGIESGLGSGIRPCVPRHRPLFAHLTGLASQF